MVKSYDRPAWKDDVSAYGTVHLFRFTPLVLAALWSGSASADWGTGNDFYERCGDPNNGWEIICISYVAGVMEGYKFEAEPMLFCPPDGNTYGQVVDITLKYLKDRPENRHFSAAASILISVVEAWPCQR